MMVPESGARRRVLLSVALIVVAVLVVLTFSRAQRRVERDPSFCTAACHHRTDSPKRAAAGDWHANGHATIACQQCHTTAMGAGLTLYWQSLVGKTESPARHGKVVARTCTSCHEARPAEWRIIAETTGHREHRGAKSVDCLSCHASGSHANEAPGEVCVKCHKAEKLHKVTVTAETCLSCHNYSASTKGGDRTTTAICERCHGTSADLAVAAGSAVLRPMKDINAHVLHGDVACQLCHTPHASTQKSTRVAGPPSCVRCHQFEIFQAGTQKVAIPEGHRNCEGCHIPHAPLQTALDNCVTCHEKNATGVSAVGRPGGTTALKHKSCASCHLPHSWRAERSGCVQCHDDKARLILTRSPVQHSACTNCHAIHGNPPTGAVCLTCHANTKGSHVALAPARHKDCTSCHNPHAPRPQDTRTSCSKCHTTELAEVMRDGPQGHTKEGCFGCHRPHDNPLPPPSLCAQCHAERAKVVATAGPAKHRTCTSCHERHKFKITDVAPACAKCHGTNVPASGADGKVVHQGDCKKCHTLHGSPGVAVASCLKCHEKVASEFNASNAKHAVCRSCHQPHKPAGTAPARCPTCHEAKVAVAAKWPANSAHAKACTGCHQQHNVRNKKPCGSCHAQEVASATGGRHQCVQCHPPHNAPPGTGAAWWTRCNECHGGKVASVKQRGPKHSECKNCHEPHRFAVPSCTSCHKEIAAKGLHATPQHFANCNKCHDPHVKSSPAPEQCLACHTKRRGHEPNAQVCQACHMFLDAPPPAQ
jgi:predicted CXXCH cytochrome family protein